MSTAPATSGRRLPGFDGLRAFAALLVLVYHVVLSCGLSRTGPAAFLLAQLKAGVAIFFVISGFLLYLPHARALAAGRPLPDWRTYASRRAARILPGYWAALTLLALGPLSATIATGAWWRYYGLAQIYNPDTISGGLIVAWSLCVEATFYLMLPILARGISGAVIRGGRSEEDLGRRAVRVQLLALGAMAGASLLMRFSFTHSLLAEVPHTGFMLSLALPGFLDWFAAGMGLAVLLTVWESDAARGGKFEHLAGTGIRCWALSALCFVLAAFLQPADLMLPLYGVASHLLQGVGALLFVLPATAPNRASRVSSLLASRPLVWLGTISYGIYLWHVPVITVLRGPLADVPAHPAPVAGVVWTLIATATGAVGLAALSWYLVERPAQRAAARRAPAVTRRLARA